MRRRLAVVSALAALVLLAACGGSGGKAKPSELINKPNAPYSGFGLDPALPRPQFTLTDTSGKQFNFGLRTKGVPTLLYFGYTSCPDVCPTTMADIATALRQQSKDLQRKTQVVFVTTDVKHDSGPVISAWLRHFDGDLPAKFIGLRGSQAQIDAAQATAHVTVAEDEGKLHAANVLLYGADNYAHVQFLATDQEADQIAHDLRVIAAQS